MPQFINRLFQRKSKPVAANTSPAHKGLGPGSIVANRYRLDAEIGRGGMGIVYRAQDLTAERDVALKLINPETADVRTREAFLHEAQISSRLRHPHIVEVLEVGTIDTGASQPAPFIAIEYVRGTSLDRMHHLPIARVIDLARQICDALAYAHGQGFVHRDLKPQNVLLEKRGFGYVAKLADFGLARPVDAPQPASDGPTGTVYYIAPEVIAGQPGDVASDLYSFGAMLYEMVTGRVPFSNYDEASILAQHLNELVRPPSETRPDVQPALEGLILRLLDKDPSKRHATAQQVCIELAGIAETRGSAQRQTNLQEPSTSSDYTQQSRDVRHLLEECRMVTLVGSDAQPNALAAIVGSDLLSEFRDGVWQVELRDCTEPGCVPQTVASVLNVREQEGRSLIVSLRQHLQDSNLLLILSGCGGLAAACARLAEMVLQTCPEVYILATAPAPLGIAGEHIYTVP